jgi:hypothetical protein
MIPGATIRQEFQRASSVPFTLIVYDELADNEEGVDLSAEDFVDKLWLLAITLLLIMISGENLIEPGRLREEEEAKIRGRKADGILVTKFPGSALLIDT